MRQTCQPWIDAATAMAWGNPNNAALQEYAQGCRKLEFHFVTKQAYKCGTCNEVFLGDTMPAAKALTEEHKARMHGWQASG